MFCLIETKWIILLELVSNAFISSVKVNEPANNSTRRIHMKCKKVIGINSIDRCSSFDIMSKQISIFITKLFFMKIPHLGGYFISILLTSLRMKVIIHFTSKETILLSPMFISHFKTPHVVYLARSSPILNSLK